MKKIELSDAETATHLSNSLKSIGHLSDIYDQGHHHIAPQIATILVNITVNEGKNVSIIRQLTIDNKIQLYTSDHARVDSRNLLPENRLIVVKMGDTLEFEPMLDNGAFPFDKKIGVKEWLREQVIKQDSKWSRQQILLAVRNMEGSHVDRFVSEDFRKLKYSNPFGVMFMKGLPQSGAKPYNLPPYSAVYAAVRHMAFEVRKALMEQIKFV